jgi:S-adenosylmethionine:tRNA-ribosyltransferase-isomerase (queuine synthetase)
VRALGQPPSSARLRRHQHLHHAGLWFQVVDNDQLPKSTLMMLVSALAG